MYRIEKRLEISAAHNLKLDYESKCENIHGHNWIIVITCEDEKLNNNGMLYDFTHIKKKIQDKLDHKYLNDIFSFNPTAENMAKWIADEIGDICKKVSVQESEGNIAYYER
jgi:6-pyruvoyltetrahydropterin/6-carboxytetrahydropterin synthase